VEHLWDTALADVNINRSKQNIYDRPQIRVITEGINGLTTVAWPIHFLNSNIPHCNTYVEYLGSVTCHITKGINGLITVAWPIHFSNSNIPLQHICWVQLHARHRCNTRKQKPARQFNAGPSELRALICGSRIFGEKFGQC
jgi:hypothetical protein